MRLSWTLLNDLAEQHGDSFYLLDLPVFESNYHRFLKAFREFYPNCNIAYSYKTNYAPKLCGCVNAAGGYAEVVSGMEYNLAIRVGVSPARVIFNGPYKSHDETECALLSGSTVNLDALGEVDVIEAIARRFPRMPLRVGIRCNFFVDGQNPSRFGVDVEAGDLEIAVDRLRRLANCDLVGLHCHLATNDKSPDSFSQRTANLLELSQCYFGTTGPRMIDVGGGYFSGMSPDLQKQFAIPIPSYRQYAAAIAPQVARAYCNPSGPELILEPGSALIADAMRFVARIVQLKKAGSRTIAVASGSVLNIKPTRHNKNMPVRLFRSSHADKSETAHGPLDIVGYTCMDHDCLHREYNGDVSVGDYAIFDNVGAYTTVMKPPFIQPSPAIVAARADSLGFELVKRREEASDIFATYVFEDSAPAGFRANSI